MSKKEIIDSILLLLDELWGDGYEVGRKDKQIEDVEKLTEEYDKGYKEGVGNTIKAAVERIAARKKSL
jgi:hypothetical protein